MPWKRLLAYITGTVDQDLLLRNEYLVAENQILRGQIRGRLRLAEVVSIVSPDTIIGLAPPARRQEVRWVKEARQTWQADHRF